MTWNELKSNIEKMPKSELDKEVNVWGEEKPLTAAHLSKADEDMMYNFNWDDCVRPRSETEPEDLEDPETYIVCEKGFHYLWVD